MAGSGREYLTGCTARIEFRAYCHPNGLVSSFQQSSTNSVITKLYILILYINQEIRSFNSVFETEEPIIVLIVPYE